MTGAPGAQPPCESGPVEISGPAGVLQAQLLCPAAATGAGVAVVCHPHPLHGGTMDNKVVYYLAKTFNELGMPCLRFNFRGVGTSAGTYDQGNGEVEDLRAVLDWTRRRFGEQPLWLAGFSFGAWIVLQAQSQVRPYALVTVAPPAGLYPLAAVPAPACPWLVIQGDADEVVAADQVFAWLSGYPQARLAKLAQAGHFFHRRLNDVRAALLAFAQPLLAPGTEGIGLQEESD